MPTGRIWRLGEWRLKPQLSEQNLPSQVSNALVREGGLGSDSREFIRQVQSPN